MTVSPAASPAQKLPELLPLQTRVTFMAAASDGKKDHLFIDFKPLQDMKHWPGDGPRRFTSLRDAERAARQLGRLSDNPVAVMAGKFDHWGGDKEPKPSFFLTQLTTARAGEVQRDGTGTWQEGPWTIGHLPKDADIKEVATKDLSEMRYIMWDESVQAIVDGTHLLRRNEYWKAGLELPAH